MKSLLIIAVLALSGCATNHEYEHQHPEVLYSTVWANPRNAASIQQVESLTDEQLEALPPQQNIYMAAIVAHEKILRADAKKYAEFCNSNDANSAWCDAKTEVGADLARLRAHP